MDMEERKRRTLKIVPIFTALCAAGGAFGGGWEGWMGPVVEKFLYSGGVALTLGLLTYLLTRWLLKKTLDTIR